jgi:hypothetical protein
MRSKKNIGLLPIHPFFYAGSGIKKKILMVGSGAGMKSFFRIRIRDKHSGSATLTMWAHFSAPESQLTIKCSPAAFNSFRLIFCPFFWRQNLIKVVASNCVGLYKLSAYQISVVSGLVESHNNRDHKTTFVLIRLIRIKLLFCYLYR